MDENIIFTKKEEDTMCVLWQSQTPLTISEICKFSKEIGLSLNQSTVQVATNKLITYGAVGVSEIKKTSTSFARAFEPLINSDQYIAIKMKQVIGSVEKKRRTNFLAALIHNENLTESEYRKLLEQIEELRKR